MARLVLLVGLLVWGLSAAAPAAETVVSLRGEVAEGAETHFFLPFDVPEGTVEIEVRHDDLSSENILDWGLEDPMIESELAGRRRGARVEAVHSTLRATVTGGDGLTLRVIRNAEILEELEVRGDPFVHETAVEAPALGEDRYRHEVGRGADLMTMTSYTWLAMPSADGDEDDGCAVVPARKSGILLWLACAALPFALETTRRSRP